MQKILEDIFAECNNLLEDVSVLQESADRYFDFAYLIKDDHIQKSVLAEFKLERDKWETDYANLVDKNSCSISDYDGFFAKGKRLHQTITDAVRKEYIKVKEQAYSYANKLSKGILYVKDSINEFLEEVNKCDKNCDTELHDSCKQKLLNLTMKVKAVENEFVLVDKSLETKLECSTFLHEMEDECSEKCRNLKSLFLKGSIQDLMDRLQEQFSHSENLFDRFYKDIVRIISDSQDIQREKQKCHELKELLKDSPATVGALLQNKKNMLRTFVERDCSALIIKTKLEIIQNSNLFEQLYEEAINYIYKQISKEIEREKDKPFFQAKQSELERLHEQYIKNISPLYSFFYKGWGEIVTDKIIG